MMGNVRLAALCLAAALALPAAAQRYRLHDPGPLWYPLSIRALGVNNNGVMVGDNMQAFMGWRLGSGYFVLGPTYRHPSQLVCIAEGVNDSGWVVGQFEWHVGGRYRPQWPFVWRPGRGYFPVPAPSAAKGSGSAYGVSESGFVCGEFIGSDGMDPFLWSESRGVQLLQRASSVGGATAFAVNSSGVSVGAAALPLGQGGVAARWSPDGQIEIIGRLTGDTNAWATGVTEDGTAVGWTSGPTGRRGWMARPGGQLQVLFVGSPEAVNAGEEIVGTRSFDGGQSNQAFIWSAAQGMRDLNTLVVEGPQGWRLYQAYGINDRGDVVGLMSNGSVTRGYYLERLD